MPANWYYRDITLEIQATLIYKDKRYIVPIHGGESAEHALFKVAIAAHLLAWGYNWNQIYFETTPKEWPSHFRPDVYARGEGQLPSFWFECIVTDNEKLSITAKMLPSFRIVHAIDIERFKRIWNGEYKSLLGINNSNPDELEDWKERRRLVMSEREAFIPPNTECWTLYGSESASRILYAVRRERNGQFIYMDTGEGWSLSSFRYVFNRKSGFRPLISNVVGNKDWKGLSQANYE